MTRPLPSVTELLGRLVRCPSTSAHGEAGIVGILYDLLEPWADEICITEPAPGRPNLVARFDGCDKSRSYAFESHSDTVSADGMVIDPFGAEVRDGKVHGRGACDTKGPMTAMLLALLGHLRDHGCPPVTWYFISPCDEELGCTGARHLVQGGFRCDGIIVGEPTSLRPVAAHKGAVRHRVEVRGLAAHSSTPGRGANAVHAAADFILRAEQAVAALDSPPCQAEPGGPTFSAGIIRGGTQVNRIPDEVVIETDFRLPPGMAAMKAERVLETVGQEVTKRRPRIRVALQRTQEYPAFELPLDSPFRPVLAPLLGGGWNEPARYATDAGCFAAAGIPCVVYGPGDIAQAHTADEWIELAQVEQAIRILRQVLRL